MKRTKENSRCVNRFVGSVVLIAVLIWSCAVAEETTWQFMVSGTSEDLRDVWGTGSNDVFAVGQSGIILHYDRDGDNDGNPDNIWEPMDSPTGAYLTALWGSGQDDVYAVGYGPTILRYDGNTWTHFTPIPSGINALHGIWVSSDGKIFAVGEGPDSLGHIICWNGSSWSHDVMTGPLVGSTATTEVWGRGPDDVYVSGLNGYSGGATGLMYHYDGSTWRLFFPDNLGDFDLPKSRGLGGILGSTGSLFLAGQSFGSNSSYWHGQILYYDGTTWNERHYQEYYAFGKIWASSLNDVYVVAWVDGVILHGGSDLAFSVTADVGSMLFGIWGSESGDVFVTGSGGKILHLGPINQPPVAVCKNVTVEAGSDCVADASIDDGSYDPDGDVITITQTPAGPYPLGETEVTLTATDDSGASDTCTATVTVIDAMPPVITLNGDATITLECRIDSYTEPGASAVDNCDSGVSVAIGGDMVDTSTCGTYIVTYNATDASGNVATEVTRTVIVQDTTPPDITIIAPQSYGLYAAGGLTLDFSAYDLVSGSIQPPALSASLTDGAGYPGPAAPGEEPGAGVYTLDVTAEDQAENEAHESVLFVVYDPTGGFVTGGGWIYSEAGAYRPDTALEGKANFGFVSKYKKGATFPTGQTEFVFQAGALNFHSSSYEWLVVTGSNYARFKGWGTINGEGDYRFMLWAGDDAPDTFRIKIWWEEGEIEHVVYDNGMDQPIGGGSIVVHTK